MVLGVEGHRRADGFGGGGDLARVLERDLLAVRAERLPDGAELDADLGPGGERAEPLGLAGLRAAR